ncbi:MAG: hypothetical protein DHS20C07_30200 [Methyloligella sp.]|jgi:hypothetical protein|nr:MAG: hypothetical protein DHS20C07_30200 [Methyloligella sp.]
MKNILKTLLIATALTSPIVASAGNHDNGQMGSMKMCTSGEKCSMTDQMGKMQTKMGGMMTDMQGMMEMMKDPTMKKNMQKMHIDMGGMMQHMKQMGTMMGGKGMMHGQNDKDKGHGKHEH